MTLTEFNHKRKKLQLYTWYGLPLVVIGGWFYPLLGFLLLGCMAGALGIAWFKGRAWCDWMCPRGSFYDLFLDRLSAKRRIPAFFRSTKTRIAVIILLFAVLGVQIYFAWPSMEGIGLAFVIVLTVTTSIGIVLGIAVHPRTWCHICPMGTIANWMSGGKKPLRISEACISCGICDKTCPMQLAPSLDREGGVLTDNDCIKCGTCIAACPKKALAFEKLEVSC
jgi:ferredoxin-type protein NapH